MKKSIVVILTLCILLSTCLFVVPAIAEEAKEHTCTFADVVVKEATCTERGVKAKVCECGKVEGLSVVNANGHDYESDTPTFDGTSKHSYTCKTCGTVTEDCEFSTSTTDATCKEAGTVVYECSKCKGKVTKENATLEHSFVYTKYDTDKDTHEAKCSLCSEVFEDVACTFEFKEDTATCTAAGEKISVCLCGNESKEPSEAKGHSTVYYTAAGKHYSICTVCLAQENADCTYTVYTTKDGKHSSVCDVCKAAGAEAECTAETYAHVDGTKTHKGACTVCKAEVVKDCELTYTKDETEGSTKHTAKCSVCTKEYEAEDCTAAEYTAAEDGKHTATCVCGRVLSHDAAFAEEYTFDAEKNTHSRKCANCNLTESHEVKNGEWAKAEGGKHTATCTECGTVVEAACTYTYAPYTEETEAAAEEVTKTEKHIGTCSVCGNTTEPAACKDSAAKDEEKSKAATCTEKGLVVFSCTLCKQEVETEFSGEISATGHQKAKDAKPVEGKEVKKDDKGHTYTYLCTKCNNEFELTEDHTFGDAVAAKDKKHTLKCTCGYEKSEACTEESIPAVEPTCSAEGSKEGKQCKVCKQVLVEPTKVDKDETKHVVVKDEAVAPTCKEEGLTEGEHCSACNKVLKKQTKVDKVAHTEVKEEAVAETCTKNGKTESSYCSVCKEVIKEAEEIKAHGHDFKFSYSDATCNSAGNYYYECSKCGEETKVEGLKAPATGKHKFVLVKTVPATAEENGYQLYQCTAKGCTQTKTVELVYNVNTGTSAVLASAAAAVLMAGAAYLVTRNKKKQDETAA